ncbi:MAG: YceI family protein [Verrucomicrobiales bacterium]|nr:YceI family protein [Verrucomicrobiales bacterium]
MKNLIAVGLLFAAVHVSQAAAIKFDFKDPKGVNTVNFTMDAPLEAISGSANGISGEVHFDPAQPSGIKGTLTVDAASMQVPNAMMKQHMHGKDWMDVATHPTLVFEAVSLSDAKTVGEVTTAQLTGKLTMKGVTKTVTVPVKISYLKDKLEARTNGQMKGDLLVIRSNFTVKRSDFGINPKAPVDKVADEVALTLSVAGSAPRS